MIKALLFDYGGVMTKGGGVGSWHEISVRLSRLVEADVDQADEFLKSIWDDYVIGKLTKEQLWDKCAQRFNCQVPLAEQNIWYSWTDQMKVLPAMTELLLQLKNDGLQLGLVSNVMPDTAADIQAHGGYDLFDFLILSCQVGLAKPNPAIYKLALSKLQNITPDQVVFIDDQERCLEPARSLGMQTILAKDPQQIRADIARLTTV